MSILLNGSTQYLKLGSAPATAAPLSMSAWMKTTDLVNFLAVLSLENGTHRFLMQCRGAVAGDLVAAATYGGGWAIAETTSGYSSGTWHHVLVVYASSSSRYVYIDGGSKGTNSSSQTPAGINEFLVGATYLASLSNYFPGRIAHPAIWDMALGDSDATALAGGDNPLNVQSANLVAYWPLYDSGWSAVPAVSDLTAVNSPTYDTADNPTVDEVAPTSVTISGTTEIYEGYDLTLVATASGGSGNYTYQWNKEGSPITGQTSQTLSITSVDSDDAGSYTCTVTNGGGSATSSIATVTISSPTVAFVVVGQRSASSKNVWAYNEAGVLLWSYDTASTTLYGVMFDSAGRVVVWGIVADNGDGDGNRSIWRLKQDGTYVDGANVGVVYGASCYGGVLMTCGSTNDIYWLNESDLTTLDTDTTTIDGAFACLRTTDGNSWYGYQNNVVGPDYYYIREMDVNRDEVFSAYIQVVDNEQITALKENSSAKVIAFSSGSATVRQHTSGGAGGFNGDWDTTLTGWGSLTTYQNALYVDQNDSDKIYVVSDGLGVLNSSGTELYNVSQPAKGFLLGVGPHGTAGKAFAVSQKMDGCNFYMWDQTLGELIGVKDLEGPDDADYLYGLAIRSSVTWNFAISEKLDYHSTDNLADNVTDSVQIAQTFTLSDYKKTGLVILQSYRASSADVTVSIQGVDGSGKPDGVDLCSGTLTLSNQGDSSRYNTYVFMSTTPVLSPGTYAIVVKSDGTSIPIGVDNAGGHSGNFWDSMDSGASWSAGTYSLAFELWGDESGYTLPSFDSQSGDETLDVGQTPTPLSVVVSGNPTPTYQWYADGSPISGATSSTYAPPAQSEAKSISYVCRATNVLGSTDSSPMVVTWNALPVPGDPVTYKILNMQLDIDRT